MALSHQQLTHQGINKSYPDLETEYKEPTINKKKFLNLGLLEKSANCTATVSNAFKLYPSEKGNKGDSSCQGECC